MIIGLEGFGSVWSTRNAAVTERIAFYNTTGIMLDGRLRHRSRLFGQVRFNGIGGFNPKHIEANIGRVFKSAGFRDGGSPCLLLHHLLSRPLQPDYYLFRVISEDTGILEVDRAGWKSEAVVLLSLSQFREQQEAMLLVPVYGWIRGALGRFIAEPSADRPWRASLLRDA
ncbi:MAG: hypothetical protein DMG11_26905 [Acidobacteria bacterium]|nr:MAG: hypothetical protein DMG11_26905 [Acidobacteriota bacterium]